MLTFTIVAVQVVLLAAPEAPRAETSSRCAEFSKSAPPARVEGSVVTRDRRPRSGVSVRATLPETGRVYTTTSDREGRFAFDGFDSDVTMDLELGDASMKAWCSLRITRKQPVRAVTVMLDRWIDDAVGDVGCEGLPRWSGQGHIEIIYGDRTQADGDAQEKPARLELRSRDIVLVSWQEDGAPVLMNETATKALQAFTAENLNRPAEVTIDGMSTSPKGAPVVYGVVNSGVVFVSEDALRGPLCETLEALPQATR